MPYGGKSRPRPHPGNGTGQALAILVSCCAHPGDNPRTPGRPRELGAVMKGLIL